MKILTIGCSHSSNLVGRSWPNVLSDKFPVHEYTIAHSCGAGNEFTLQKMISILTKDHHDLVICQLSEPSRLVLGLGVSVQSSDDITHGNIIGDSLYYTFNPVSNDDKLERIIGKKFENLDKFMLQYAIPSNFNLQYKITHTMLAMKALCDSLNTKLVFFSWFCDLTDTLKNQNLSTVFDGVLIPGYAEKILQNYPEFRAPCWHVYEDGHKILVDELILPYIEHLLIV